MTAILDTSVLLAALDTDAELHRQCREAVASTPGPLVVSPMVLAELDYLLGQRGYPTVMTQTVIPDVAEGAYTLAHLGPEDLLQAANVMTTYADLRIGLTDALNVVLADTYRTALMLTLDERHFRVVRPLRGRSAFTLVPLDFAPAT